MAYSNCDYQNEYVDGVFDGHLHFALPQRIIEGHFAFVIGDEDCFLIVFLSLIILVKPKVALASHVVELVGVGHLG